MMDASIWATFVWAEPTELERLREHTIGALTYSINWLFIVDGTTYTDVVLGASPLRVNSLHNQAIDEIAAPFQLAARDRDGFVQAIEHPGHEFMIGVQWHPEYLPYAKQHRKLFAAFACAVKASSKALPMIDGGPVS